MSRHSRYRHVRMTPADRRQEVVAILSRGLCRLHDRGRSTADKTLRPRRESACFPLEKAAQCVSNGAPTPEAGVNGAENDEDAR